MTCDARNMHKRPDNLLQGQDLVVGNVGDSRAVLATRDANNSLTAVQLTVDLKPNLPGIISYY